MKNTDNDKQISMFITLPIQKSKQQSFLEVMNQNVKLSREEDGNICFDAFIDTETDNVYIFERWQSQESLNKHSVTAHVKNVKESTPPSLRTNEQRVQMDIVELSDFSPAKKSL